jgi:hypothetical protein
MGGRRRLVRVVHTPLGPRCALSKAEGPDTGRVPGADPSEVLLAVFDSVCSSLGMQLTCGSGSWARGVRLPVLFNRRVRRVEPIPHFCGCSEARHLANLSFQLSVLVPTNPGLPSGCHAQAREDAAGLRRQEHITSEEEARPWLGLSGDGWTLLVDDRAVSLAIF